MGSKFKLPTETVDLPSKGLLYPEDSPLAKGTIEMKYMTAKEEDMLTNQNYINDGTVIDRLLQSLIVTEGVDFNDILIGDKNAIMVAARILSYGKDYQINYGDSSYNIDLSELKEKEVDNSVFKDRKNNFTFKLPHTGNEVSFKLLTHGDEIAIEKEINGLKKINKQESSQVTSRLKYIVTSINGLTDIKDVREFVDKYLLAKDARALIEEYARISPDVDLKFYPEFSGE